VSGSLNDTGVTMNRKRLITLSVTIALVIAVAGTVFAQKKAAPAAKEDTSNLMDINTAPPEKLMTLNGIDIVLAKKIIAGRPYKVKTDLTARKIIPQAAYDGIWNKITANPIKK
jgi:DNA uptake protein ComE-like DNA-binding protein